MKRKVNVRGISRVEGTGNLLSQAKLVIYHDGPSRPQTYERTTTIHFAPGEYDELSVVELIRELRGILTRTRQRIQAAEREAMGDE